MEKESLTRAKQLIIKALNNDKQLNKFDRLELIMNLCLFLNEIKYNDNIRVLNKELKYDNSDYRKR